MMPKVLETAEDVFAAFGVDDTTEPGGENEHVFAPAGVGQGGQKPPRPVPPVAAEEPRFRFLAERGERTIDLIYPFAVRDQEYRSYTLRRLNAEQSAEVGEELRRLGDMATLYSALTGLPFMAMKMMDADDAEVLAAAAVNFMPAALRAALTGQP
jgi:AcrR family transcriptional regulator